VQSASYFQIQGKENSLIDSESPARHTITRRQAWVLAARPRTLPAAIGPVIVGTALAISAGAFDPLAALAALLAALLLQIASNFANDLGDFERGTDTPERVGPLRVTTAGLLTASDVKRGIVLVLALAAVCGLYLIWVGGWPILAVGVFSMLAAVAYTYGPLPFGYYGLGDVATFIFFGFIAVVGTYYVQAHAAPSVVWIAAIPMGALVTAILVVNNVRDADQDRAGGKRTLAVVLGRKGARVEYLVMLVLAYAVPIVLWLWFDMGPWVLLPLLTLPLAVRHARAVFTVLGPRLNKTLAGTAQLAVLYAIVFAIGIIAS
jgi:1,4-dihydroxy-2-naphthoate octaprenyltransferase